MEVILDFFNFIWNVISTILDVINDIINFIPTLYDFIISFLGFLPTDITIYLFSILTIIIGILVWKFIK